MLEVPLSLKQIEAASDFHATVDQWQLTDHALQKLAKIMPGWSDDECIIKCISINSLYGTQVYAILPMAQHVKKIFTKPSTGDETQLVERIARLELASNMNPRNHVSCFQAVPFLCVTRPFFNL